MSSTEYDAQIAEVLSQVKNYSKENVALVLQNNNLDVKQTITDFHEGKAQAILDQWKGNDRNTTKSKKKSNKKKKYKKEKNDDSTSSAQPIQNGDVTSHANPKEPPADGRKSKIEKPNSSQTVSSSSQHTALTNGDSNASSAVATAAQTPAKKNEPLSAASSGDSNPVHNLKKNEKTSRVRTISQQSTSSRTNKKNRKEERSLAGGDSYQMSKTMNITKNMEKSSKDLQRFAVSFPRSKAFITAEFDESYKKVKEVFKELTDIMMDREVSLFRMLDIRKEEAFSMLNKRETKSKELKRQIERAASMNPSQINDLRTEIRNFVGDPKFDHELGKAIRFTYNKSLVEEFQKFGELASVKNLSVRPRERYESTASDMSEPPPQIVSKQSPPQSVSKQSPPKIVSKQPPPLITTKQVEQEKPSSPEIEPPPSAGSNWAEEADIPPLSDTRAPWAIDTPLVNSSQSKVEQESKNKKQSPRSRRERNPNRYQKPNDKNPSNQGNDKSNPVANQRQSNDDQHRGGSGWRNRNYQNPNRNSARRSQTEPDFEKKNDANQFSRAKYQNSSRGRDFYRGRGYRGRGARGAYQNRSDRDTPKVASTPELRNDDNPLPPRNNPRNRNRNYGKGENKPDNVGPTSRSDVTNPAKQE